MHIFQIQVGWDEISSSLSLCSCHVYALYQHWLKLTCTTHPFSLQKVLLSSEELHSHEAFDGETAPTCVGVGVGVWPADCKVLLCAAHAI